MVRRALHLLLVLSLCWQSLAHAGMGVAAADPQAQLHAQLHFQGIAHHHDDHGQAEHGVHLDDSAPSLAHLVVDCGTYSPCLLPRADLQLAPADPSPPRAWVPPQGPTPCLAPLERPPRQAA
jgi:hypothetical protein